MYEICSMLTTKTPKQIWTLFTHCSVISIVEFEQVTTGLVNQRSYEAIKKERLMLKECESLVKQSLRKLNFSSSNFLKLEIINEKGNVNEME